MRLSRTIYDAPLASSESLASYFTTHDLVHARSYLAPAFCRRVVAGLIVKHTTALPTDDGNVYCLVEDGTPPELVEVAHRIARLVGAAIDRPLNVPPSLNEIVKYNDATSLGMHRDNEGDAVTKVIVTLSGTANFHTEHDTIPVSQGDLIMMRGREFVDVPTPLHGTSENYDRYMLLVEPSYLLPMS